MRDIETLGKEIDGFTLETTIRREVKYTAADIPALERENAADLERLKTLVPDSTEAQYLRDETIRVRTRKIEWLRDHKVQEITENKHETVPQDQGISALGAHIRATWTIREILVFKSFTHGGIFSAPDGGWRIDYAGYVAKTAEGMSNLVRLFDSLHAEALAYLGAWLYACMNHELHNVTLLRNADDFMDVTLNALVRNLPPALSAQLKGFQAVLPPLLSNIGNVLNEVRENTRPRPSPPGKYNVTQEEAARRLGRSVRTIKNWEAGKNTPEGYSRETRRTLETFMAWASGWEAAQKSKLNTKKAMRYADERGYTFGAPRW